MVQKGEFKIGTLDDFKKDKRYGNEIGDPREGTKSRYSTEDIDTDQPGPQLEFFEQEILKHGSPNYWELKGIKWQNQRLVLIASYIA